MKANRHARYGKPVTRLALRLSLAAFFTCGCATADEAAANAPDRSLYVAEGETLNNVLRTQYSADKAAWSTIGRKLIRANPHVFVEENPNAMREGTRLRLVTYRSESSDIRLVPAGSVEEARGTVTAVDITATTRGLSRGDLIYAGDTISTGDSATARLSMKDESQIFLRERSSLAIDRFAYDPSTRKGNSFIRLVGGGFRAITGFIGKKDKKNYRVETPVATIGIRGTDYAVRLCGADQCRDPESNKPMPEGVYVGVLEGAVSLDNDAGSFTVESGEAVRAESSSVAPVPDPRGSTLVFDAGEIGETAASRKPRKEWGRFGGG